MFDVYPSDIGLDTVLGFPLVGLVAVASAFGRTQHFLFGLASLWVAVTTYITYTTKLDLTIAYVLLNQLLFKSILLATASFVQHPHYLLMAYGSGFFYSIWFLPHSTQMLYVDNAVVSLLVLLVGIRLQLGKVSGLGSALCLMNLIMIYEAVRPTRLVLFLAATNACLLVATAFGYKLLTNKMLTAEPCEWALTTAREVDTALTDDQL